MTTVEGARPKGLVERAMAILLSPSTEWNVVAEEPATVPGLFLGYACILALLPLIGSMLGRALFHGIFFHGFFGAGALVGGLVLGLIGYALSLGVVFVASLIISALAPSFDAKSDPVQALKVAVYANTAGWVVGIVSWIPVLGWLLGLAALGYGCYLLYLGVAKVMKPPAEKAVGYTLVVIAIEIVLTIIVWWVIGIMTAMAFFGAVATGATALGANGGNLARIEAASRQIEANAKAAQNGQAVVDTNGKPIVAVDPEKLKSFLPATIAGLPQTEVSAVGTGSAGMGASDAEATYEQADKRITLKVVDLAAASGFAALATTMHVEESKQTATGYEKDGTVNGRWTTERYDNQGKDGEFSVLVASRFMVDAEGSGVSIDDLKSAVAAVGPDRLEGLAHG